MPLRRSVRLAGLVLVGVVLAQAAGCSGGGAGSGPAGSGSPSAGSTGLPQDEGGPLQGLNPCEAAPEPVEDADVPGLLLPPGAVVTDVRRQGPLTTVQAYVGQVPVLVRRFYQDAPGLTIFEIEDEVFEAEVLFADGKEHRSYVKAQATCRRGSTLLVVVAPEIEGGGLPTPTGTG